MATSGPRMVDGAKPASAPTNGIWHASSCLAARARRCPRPRTVGGAGAVGAEMGHRLAASVQGPYPIGNPSAQPDLRFAFPAAETGARDQTFRLIVTPDIWGRQARLRLSNAFGTRPVTFDGAFLGLQLASASVVPGSN